MNPSLFTNYSGPLLALASAALFGASTPVAKLLLGVTDPLLLAGLLYLGSGIGLGIIGLCTRLFSKSAERASSSGSFAASGDAPLLTIT